MNRPFQDIVELPRQLPVFPLAGCLLLPRAELPLNIFEPRYLAMVDASLASDRMIGMIQPLPEAAAETRPTLFAVGCAGKITRFAETGDGRYFISLEGVCRFRTRLEHERSEGFRIFDVEYEDFAADMMGQTASAAPDRSAVVDALRAYAERHAMRIDWDSVAKASDEDLVNSLAIMSPFGVKEKQALLEARDLRDRAAVLVAIAEMELAGDGGRAPLH